MELSPAELFPGLSAGADAAELAVQVTDLSAAGSSVLHDTRDLAAVPPFSDERTLRVGGRVWRLRLEPRPAFARAGQSREPRLLLADSMTREVREQQARIRLVLDSVADAIVAWGPDRRIEWANLAAWRLLGRGTLVGRRPTR